MGSDSSSLADQVHVVYGSLQETAGRLEAAITIIDEITGRHDSLAASATSAGNAAVSEAIQSFLHTWSYGLGCMKSDARTLATDLSTAASRYQHLEQALSQAAQPRK